MTTGRTLADLVRRIGLREDDMLELLRDSEQLGLVEETVDGWKLTASAELRFGRALRQLGPPEPADHSEPAKRVVELRVVA